MTADVVDDAVPDNLLTFPSQAENPPRGLRSSSTKPLGPWALIVVGACALVTAFAQATGQIVFDTKLPLMMTPGAFASKALHLWDPQMWNGSIQTLSFGYLFPMGGFFAVGHVLHVPVWCTERIWLALLLTTGFWGMVRLAEAMQIGTRRGRVLGALAYVIAPIVVTWAATSAALLAVVLLPWVLVPLVRGSMAGSPRRAAFASGLAVALMGGANSTVILAALPLGAVWILTRQAGRRRRALAFWWVIALVLACSWWVAGVAIQGRYGYNYLPYTETAGMTTATGSLFEALRGASFWTDHFTIGGPLVPGAWTLVSSVGPIMATTTIVAFGLAGLVRRIPERLFLVTGLAIGVIVIAAGYGGPLGDPASGWVQNLIGGPAAVLRNVSKFSPDVALPLSLGFASIASLSLRRPRLASGAPTRRRPRLIRPLLALVMAAAVVFASAPFWQGHLYHRGGFSAIPSYWNQTAGWLDAHQDHGTALLAPAANFGEYTWGRPLDEPLSVLASSSWSVRSLIPFGSNGNDQVLDAFEASLDRGVPDARMAQFLAGAGFDYVVVRNDLDLRAVNAPPPDQVRQVLAQTPGLRLVASFGPVVSSSQANPSGMAVYNLDPGTPLRSVQIYRVKAAAPIVRTYPATDPVLLSGSAPSLLALLDAGVLQGRATLLTGDTGSARAAVAPSATWADTDGNQRRDSSFGSLRNNQSYVLAPDQRSSIAQHNVPQNLAVVKGDQHQTVADPFGAANVSASTFSSTPLALDTAQGPAAAFDNDRSTAWAGYARNNSVGQWVQVSFGRSVNLHSITILPLADGSQRPTVKRVTISTAQGSVQRSLHRGTNTVTVPSGASTWMRVTLQRVQAAHRLPLSGFPLGAGFTSIRIPGVHYVPALSLPNDEEPALVQHAAPVDYAFSAPLANANLTLGQTNDDDPLMVRRFDVPAATKLTVVGQATPTPGPSLSALLPTPVSNVSVTSSSALGRLPHFAPTNLTTGSSVPWIAGQGDTHPSLTFTWSGNRSIDYIDVVPTPQAGRPLKVRITTPLGSVVRPVPTGGGAITFPAVSTSSLTVTFVKVSRQVGLVPASRQRIVLPVGVAHLSIPALGPVVSSTAPNRPVQLPCGQGPSITLDGHVLQTELMGSTSALENLTPLGLVVCGGPVALSSGDHTLTAGRLQGAFKVTALEATSATSAAPATLTASATTPTATLATAATAKTPATPATRSVRITGQWSSDRRTMQLAPGGASYLAVAQNYNVGWKATLHGKALAPVRLDGWEQAWVVPAGAGGTVVMTFPADTVYREALLGGAILVALLAALALLRVGRRNQAPAPERARVPLLLLGVMGFAVLVVVGGPLALAFLPLVLVARRWGRAPLAWLAFAAFIASGVFVARAPGAAPETLLGAYGKPAQALAALALAAVLAALLARPDKGTSPEHRTADATTRET